MKKQSWIGGVTVAVSMLAVMPVRAQNADHLPARDLTLSTESVGTRFIAAHGQRAAIFGYPAQGLEAWAWPYQIFDGYKISFVPDGSASEIAGDSILRRVEYRPESVTRIYVGTDFVVREKLFAPIDQPGTVITYTVEGRGQVCIRVHFRPQMNLMWPAAVGGQGTQWSDALKGYVLRDTLNGYSATIASPEIVAHDDTANVAIRTSDDLALEIQPHASGEYTEQASLVIAEDDPGVAAGSAAKDLLTKKTVYMQQAAEHYAALQSHSLRITTPDDEVNQALAWAEVALDQAWVCNARLGCGEVAGYGPSRPGRRPQYAWFFAGDGLEAEQGLVAAGEYARARQELEFILHYQNHETGMIWHELSQSAGFLDWEHKYPYMFVHVDVTFQFLAAVANYVQVSGDNDFARRHWMEIEKAYDYCRALIDPATHLPRIPADKEGSNEQDRESDELSLSAAWMDAAGAYAVLAMAAGHPDDAAPAIRQKEDAARAIAARYWDASHQFWISAHTVAGADIFNGGSRPAELLVAPVFTEQQRSTMLDRIASSDYQADWGTRGIPASASDYDPNAYAHGSIFALGATSMASAYWQAHRPATAFAIWDGVIAWNSLDSLGHLHEVTAGDLYYQEMESVPEQTWSSAGLLTSVTEGLLGLKIDGAAKQLRMAPHFPPQWGEVSVSNIAVGHGTLQAVLQQTIESVSVQVTNTGEAVNVTFAPEIPQGAEDLSAECDGRMGPLKTDPAKVIHEEQDEHAELSFIAAPGDTKCRIHFHGGVAVLPPLIKPQVGESSRGLKLVDVNLAGRLLTLSADVNPDGPHAVELRSSWRALSVDGGLLTDEGNGLIRVEFPHGGAESASDGYVRRKLVVHFE
ncbi:hypothetical protein [Silvibacterium dinghuense]|uniref:Uncharacterized protein n=1 Tax=Silvibacterium dinghuense TaxID=1560006 RepID=A0A4Q1SG88_9BACT|nr:hypothetical protein [Silvibacterium dinghuense]RXS96561.1 hypothetical protein ESZ00_00980 [Silvibacterium dinghuense]GGG91783.1 hypothetical protein GCM10011586_03030 [Silvibacterium dinghuense]